MKACIGEYHPVFLSNIKNRNESKAVYLGIHFDRQLTRRCHIETKKV